MKYISILLCALLISDIELGIDSHAASIVKGRVANNSTGETITTAKFRANSQTITPVDPDHPNIPSNKGDGSNGAHVGSGLSLIYVSKKLSFGSHEINILKPKTYIPISDDSSLWNDNFVIEVSDVRGTNAGWRLSVSGDSLVGDDGTIIKGAALSLPLGSLSNSGYASNGASSHAVKNILSSKTSDILDAEKNSGSGVTVDRLYPGAINLVIPENTTKAQGYVTRLNWSLTDAP